MNSFENLTPRNIRDPENGYRPLGGQRNLEVLGVNPRAHRPFHYSVYEDSEAIFPRKILSRIDIPRSSEMIHPWIPGVSTPEGILLVSLPLATVASDYTMLVERLASFIASVSMFSISAGVPTLAVWITKTGS